MNRILAIVAVWQRPEITEVCFSSLRTTGVDVLVCGSEGNVSRKLTEQFNFHYIEFENLPLSNKHNALTIASKNYDWDYIWLIGSDTIVTPDILSIYEPTLEKNPPWCGLRDLYFYVNKEFYYWEGYGNSRSDSIGAGRMFSRNVVEQFDWMLWPKDMNRSLDSHTSKLLTNAGFKEHHIYQKDTSEYLLEVRSQTQMTGWSYFQKVSKRITMPDKVLMALGSLPSVNLTIPVWRR